MPVGAAIGGAAVIGAGSQIISGNKAAKAQQQASAASVGEQRREYDLARDDLAPWRTTGASALSRLASMYGVGGTAATGANGETLPYGGFAASPGYQWRRDEALRAVDRGAAARGMRRSEATIQAERRVADGLASSEYENFANRLAGLAGIGQNSASQTGQMGIATGQGISQALMAGGNARASSYANTGSAINSGINNVLQAYLFSQNGGFGGMGKGY
jgi:hypothetical protein